MTTQELGSCLSEYNQRKARDEALKVLAVAKKQNRPVVFVKQGISGEEFKKGKKRKIKKK